VKTRLFAAEKRRWWTLAAVTFGLFMILLDNTVVNVALPAMQRDLHLRASELEWIVVGYSLSFATFMLTGGKLADLLERRLLFVVGLFIFSAASLACDLTGSAALLIGAYHDALYTAAGIAAAGALIAIAAVRRTREVEAQTAV